MGTVFPASGGEQCPGDNCGSRQVERLGARADFGSLNLDSPAQTLWLRLTCQRPFKLVKCGGAQVGPATARGRQGPGVQLGAESALDAAPWTGRRH
jgi:hypothetical protein